LFEDGGRFGADTSLPHNQVLSVANPSAFGFIGPNPGSITVQDSELIVEEKTKLSLIGGDIEIDGGTIAADSGGINLVSVNSAGEALITPNDGAVETFSEGGAIKIQESVVRTIVNASENPNTGSISIQGGELMVENSEIVAHTHGSDKDTGNIDVNADQITLSNSQIKTIISQWWGGKGGNISMFASEFIVLDKQTISSEVHNDVFTDTESIEKGGNITFTTPELSLNSDTRIVSHTISNGHGGEIDINVDTLRLSAGSKIISKAENVDTTSNCGSIDIEARNGLMIEGSISTATEGMGDASNIRISAPVVELSGNAWLNASSRDAHGDGSSIILRDIGILLLSGESRLSASTTGTGNGGKIDIAAYYIDMNDRSLISTKASSGSAPGDGGSIILRNVEWLSLSGESRLSASTDGVGNGGQINIEAHSIDKNDHAEISTSTSGLGNAGNININVADTMTLQTDPLVTGMFKGPRITSIAYGSNPDALGSAGTITLNANRLNILNGGIVSTTTWSNQGTPANIHIAVNDLLIQSNDPFYASHAISVLEKGEQPQIPITGISSNSNANLRGGDITIHASNQVMLFSGIISAMASGTGGGGNITLGSVTSPISLFTIDDNSAIFARTQQDNSGNIFIFLDTFVGSSYSRISSDHTVEIDNMSQDVSGSILDPVDNPLITSDQPTSKACATGRIQQRSSLIVEGQGGLRLSPGNYIPSKMPKPLY
jgi:large exoprotein involved in heme utilization and adhesion